MLRMRVDDSFPGGAREWDLGSTRASAVSLEHSGWDVVLCPFLFFFVVKSTCCGRCVALA